MGSLLNATLGNVVDLMIFCVCVVHGRWNQRSWVRSVVIGVQSFFGSILSCNLLLLGISFLCAGMSTSSPRGNKGLFSSFGRDATFNRSNALMHTQMLLLAGISVGLPAVFVSEFDVSQ